ncbi:MAG: bifunctional (p)ppGpp synthetase/guanosine-3',5'-bis(diphosphate) 3'-pyrophosphohydrolase [Bacteroidales bacterium]|nr:bifunctional (p)ppGpp synthetase/guanosine-3',5'-bis(diphosphate) 3'-pyrophosphohydrolase [Bacteroidales bacterium]
MVHTAEDIDVQREFNELLNNCQRCDKRGDKAIIRKAFKVASDAHRGIRRKSGEPYIMHPIAVAKIVNHEMGLGVKSIVCALLHDVVEDTDYTIEYIENHFGQKIASIIDGLTKISGVFDNKSSFQAENFRKMLLTLSDDVRVILIKLADRLHNMRTLESMPAQKRMKIASETIYLYAPLAHRLGFYSIKTELEDLSLKHRYPEIYAELSEKIKQKEKTYQSFIEEFSAPIKEQLNKNRINFNIDGRYKSIYSIWHKMQTKNVPFEEIYDLMAIRIVFEATADIPEKTQCWNIYSMITDIYMPKPERIRDWVSTPKANGYESLHATVMGPKGHWVEIQIRSMRMDEIAERGFAAHWKYKQNNNQESELDKWIKRIRELLQSPQSDALEFLDDFKLNLFSSEIFIFTPKGEIKTMPVGVTALDFAYEIHSEIGHKAIAAKINHKLLPLNHLLKSGDQVEIITSDKYQPRHEWLNKIKTAKAKTSIKTYIKAETKNRIEKGRKILEEKLNELKLKPSSRIFKKLIPYFELTNKEELYSKIATGIIQLDNLKKILKKNTKNKLIRYWGLQFSKSSSKKSEEEEEEEPKIPVELSNTSTILLKENIDPEDSEYTIAKCCNPIPGDDVIGHKNASDEIIIHKINCPNTLKLMSSQNEFIVQAKWTTHKFLSFLVRVAIRGTDRFGVYNEITTVISKQLNVNIRTINLASHDGIWEGSIDLYVHNTKDLNNLILNISKIKGVDSISRVENTG